MLVDGTVKKFDMRDWRARDVISDIKSYNDDIDLQVELSTAGTEDESPGAAKGGQKKK